MLIVAMVMAIVFMPTSVLLTVAMIPTLVAAIADRHGSKALTVGAMNLAGTTPFLFHLWLEGHQMDTTWELVASPQTIVVIYGAAAIGYVINWSLAGIVATAIVQRSRVRLADIRKRQAYLVERWGAEVTGELPLDEDGFPILAAGQDGKNEG
ncbi:MAG: hypothetical protein KDJ15_07000 [Alphaproteobacteria bacterium]|nr:hypothetical protein [Alphaproteobacteria bacterium]